MKTHITSFFWQLSNKATPLLRLVDENGKEEYAKLSRNTNIEILEDYGKKCTGYYENNGFHNCPENNEIIRGIRCAVCEGRSQFTACARCTGKECRGSTEARKNCLEKTHFLYLTIIGDKLKVGVTKAGRYLKRWVEQGSDYACIIDSGTGKEVRMKEHELAKEISDRVRNTEKIRLFTKDNMQMLQTYLENKGLNAPIINVRKYYEGLDSIPKTPLNYSGLLKGRIVCVKGKIIIFEREQEYYYYDVNNLLVHEVKMRIS